MWIEEKLDGDHVVGEMHHEHGDLEGKPYNHGEVSSHCKKHRDKYQIVQEAHHNPIRLEKWKCPNFGTE
jgi:hypothetical protein